MIGPIFCLICPLLCLAFVLCSSYKVDTVEDSVSLRDAIWVKVLEIQEEDNDNNNNNESGRGRRRRMRLSKKDASQDGLRQDLGQQRQAEEDMKNQITQNLNSSIGMGVALDPMAAQQQQLSNRNSNIVLKKQQASSNAGRLINGYALVDDTEGELPPSLSKEQGNNGDDKVAAVNSDHQHQVRPMGRGRGTTLPAWMTRTTASTPNEGGPTGRDSDSNDDEKKRRRRRKKRKRDDERQRHRRRKEEKKKRKRKRDSSSSRRRRKDYDDDYSQDSLGTESSLGSLSSTSSSRRHRRRRRHRSRSSRRHRRRRDHDSDDESAYSREGSSDESRTTNNDKDVRFRSVEDAKKLIEKLEARKAKR